MTRRTIYRIALATLMLPNFTAYWWLLPRRMKRCRTAWQARLQIETAYWMRRAFENFQYYTGRTQIAPIDRQDFRLPFQASISGDRMSEEAKYQTEFARSEDFMDMVRNQYKKSPTCWIACDSASDGWSDTIR